MLPSGFPARSLRRDRVPEGINGAMGYYAFDAGTPIVAGTWDAAFAAARCALTAAALVAEGERRRLCPVPAARTPRRRARSTAATATSTTRRSRRRHLRDAGCARVAIVDVDYHHGNGTQDIFWTRGDVYFASHPRDAGHGVPVFPRVRGRARRRRRRGLQRAISRCRAGQAGTAYAAALEDGDGGRSHGFGADALVVSLGVDTFEDDPIRHLQAAGRAKFPRTGTSWPAVEWPKVLVQEGGYAVEEIGATWWACGGVCGA